MLLNPIPALVPAPSLSLLLVLTRRFPAHLLAPLLPQTWPSLVATEHEHLLKPQGPHLSGGISSTSGLFCAQFTPTS